MVESASRFGFLSMCLLLAGPAVSGCTQPWNSTAADAVKNAPPPPAEDFHTRVVITPNIELSSGTGLVTTSPCEATRFQVLNEDEELGLLGVLVQECSGCHGDQRADGGFDFVLKPDRMMEEVSGGMTSGMRFVVPGDPANSALFQRMQVGNMPPEIAEGDEVVPTPINGPATISQMSLVYEWIANCVGTPET